MIKLSIIVPVYNTYKYLDKCLKSLVEQKNVKCKYEIIVVNDGSPDKSEEIILKYQNKYPKLIKYIKKENGGISSARNEGLKHCKGEYITFVDSDDYVSLNLISTFLNNISNNDLFIYGYNEVNEDGNKCVENIILDKNATMTNDSKYILSMIFENKSVRGYGWNKIFKRKIIEENKLKFDNSITYVEDLLFTIEYINKCEKVLFSKEQLYNYVQRDGSLINSKFNLKKLSSLKAYKKIADIISSINKKYLPTIYYFLFELNYELSVRIRISGDLEKYKEEYIMLKKNMREYYFKFILKNVKFKYKIKATIKLLFYRIILMRY